MVIVRDEKLDLLQAIFVTFPELAEWRTKDLWSKHPMKADHWSYVGRTDDIIVFQTGEKMNPLIMEQTIESHPEIAAALLSGSGHIQSSLLLEPRKPINNDAQRAKLIDNV